MKKKVAPDSEAGKQSDYFLTVLTCQTTFWIVHPDLINIKKLSKVN